MFVVSEAEAAAIRTAFEQQSELSAAIELRRLFPGIMDNLYFRLTGDELDFLINYDIKYRLGRDEGRRVTK